MRFTSFRGYVLAPPSRVSGYEGINRDPNQLFEVFINIDAATYPDPDPLDERDLFWVTWPPGWRRDATRILEEDLGEGDLEDDGQRISLVRHLRTALRAREIIAPELGAHEVLYCDLRPPEAPCVFGDVPSGFGLLGYEPAFAGGDLTSTIRNGLFLDEGFRADPELLRVYGHRLNERGLFDCADLALAYLDDWLTWSQGYDRDLFAVYQISRMQE